MTHKVPEIYQNQDVAFCGKCKQWKPKQDFQKEPKRKNGVSGHCKICQREWRASKRQYLTAKTVEWNHNNPDRATASIKKWVEKNPDKIKIYRKTNDKKQQERRNNNPDLLERRREQNRIASRKRQRNFREDSIVRHAKRKARLFNASGVFTTSEWIDLCARFEGKCLCCKESKPLTADHIVPLFVGGTNSIENIQPLCVNCNSRKGIKTIDYRP